MPGNFPHRLGVVLAGFLSKSHTKANKLLASCQHRVCLLMHGDGGESFGAYSFS